MIWFDIKKLEDKISKKELTDKDGFNYVLAYFVFSVIVLSFITKDTSVWIKFFECAISVIITVWGLKTVYEVNNDIDGKDFFKRFFAINWVIGMRILVVTLIFAFIISIPIGIISIQNGINYNDPNPIKDIIMLVLGAMYNLICYLLIINSFRRLKPIM